MDKDGGPYHKSPSVARDGVILLGRIQGVTDGRVILAEDLKENLARADKFEGDFAKSVDDFIAKHGMDAPQEKLSALQDGYGSDELPILDLKQAVTTVIWATGV